MFGNLRLVATDKLSEYRSNTELFLRLGNEDFAAAIRAGTATAQANPTQANPYRTPWLLYHAWRQEGIQIDARSAQIIRDLIAGRADSDEHAAIARQIEQLGWCDEHLPVDLDELVKRTADKFLAIQNDYELRHFLERVRDQKPRVVVEIGTARGGMLYCFAQLAAHDATLVSIDLLFIDGDHSYAGCMADFRMYRELVGPEGLIVFHDICMFPDEWPEAAVGVAWQELKARHGGEEIIDPDGVSSRVLQPGQRWRWGIGIIEARQLQAAP